MGLSREGDVPSSQIRPGQDEAMGDANNTGKPQVLRVTPAQFQRAADQAERALRLARVGGKGDRKPGSR